MNMIVKSINERSKLDTIAYNALKDFNYYKKDCPREFKKQYRLRTLNSLNEYNRLRACFDNYQDKKTLTNDKKVNNAIKCFNVSTF